MFYAWKSATDFAVGETPLSKSQSHPALIHRMRDNNHRTFMTATRLDGAWVDLTVFDNSTKRDGALVSDERTTRYIRSRARRLDENGREEIGHNTPLPYDSKQEDVEPPAPPATEGPSASGEQVGKEQFQLNVDPVVVQAIYEFITLDKETRNIAINALAALSVSAESFEIAVRIMLDDTKELLVDFPSPAPKEDPQEG